MNHPFLKLIKPSGIVLALAIATSQLSAAEFDLQHQLHQNYGDWLQGPPPQTAVPSLDRRTGQDPEPVATGSLSVFTCKIRIIDDATGRPIPGATVSATVRPGPQDPPILSFTDVEGNYVLRRLLGPPETNVVVNRFSPTRQRSLFLSVKHTNYCPASASWYPQPGPGGSGITFPTEFEFRLVNGTSIGGIVLGPTGKPVAHATLTPNFEPQMDAPGIQRNTFEIPSGGITTDDLGRWKMGPCPSNAPPASFHVVDPNGGEAVFRVRDASSRMGMVWDRSIPAAEDKLIQGNAEFRLPEGIEVRGLVLDSSGKPVAGATVFEWYGWQPQRRGIRSVTGSDGRFTRPHRQAKEWLYAVIAPGFGSTSVVSEVKAGLPELRITLPLPSPLRVKLVDPAGQPLKNVLVALQPGMGMTERSQVNAPPGLVWCDRTDAEGRIVWSNAPVTLCSYVYIAPGTGAMRFGKWKGGGPETVVVVAPEVGSEQPAQMKVSILDAKTRLGVAPIEVSTRPMPFAPWVPMFTTNQSEFTVTYPQNDQAQPALRFKAAGFAAAVFEPNSANSSPVQEIVLTSETAQRVRLVDPEGNPIANATAWISPDNQQHRQLFVSRYENQRLQVTGQEFAKSKSDSDGWIEITISDPEVKAAIIAEEFLWSGTAGSLLGKTSLTLMPFGRVEGRITSGGKPVSNTQVAVNAVPSPSAGSFLMGNVFSTTKGDGTFVLENVLPGNHLLQRIVDTRAGEAIIEFSHSMPITVISGETLKANYTFGGRSVIGTLECDGDSPEDWSNCDVVLQGLNAQPANSSPQRFPNDFASAGRFSASGLSIGSRQNSPNTFRGSIQADASFEILDVPPGQYSLKAIVRKAGAEPRKRWEPIPVIGQTQKQVILEAGIQPKEIGPIVVKATASAPISGAAAALVLKATAGDGQLVTFPGPNRKAAILVYWSTWSEKSHGQLRRLGEWLAKSGADAELIGINVDEEPATAFAFAREKKLPGKQYAWGEELRPGEVEKCGAEIISSVWVVDRTGRLVRDPAPKRMESMLSKSTPE